MITHIVMNDLIHDGRRRQAASPARALDYLHTKEQLIYFRHLPITCFYV